jgi:hypothetical protein
MAKRGMRILAQSCPAFVKHRRPPAPTPGLGLIPPAAALADNEPMVGGQLMYPTRDIVGDAVLRLVELDRDGGVGVLGHVLAVLELHPDLHAGGVPIGAKLVTRHAGGDPRVRMSCSAVMPSWCS